MRFSEINEAFNPSNGIEQGPPFPPEQIDFVKKVQARLEHLGYSVGSTGIDGKYGPRTARAIAAFKKDFGFPGNGSNLSLFELKAMATENPVKNPTDTGNDAGGADLGDVASLQNTGKAKEVVQQFLGDEIDDRELNLLLRATAAEASPNAQERAAVAAVILNRVRSNRYPNTIEGVLTQRNQFQAVTGTRYDPGPSRNFSGMSEQTAAQVVGALIKYLPDMNKSWLNFTSNNPRAYGRGTNIAFMHQMRKSADAEVIGQTVFGTV